MELKRNDGGGDFFMGKKITKRIGGVDSHQVYKLHLSHKQKGENTVIRHLTSKRASTHWNLEACELHTPQLELKSFKE